MLLEIKKLSVRVKSSGLKAVDGIDLSVDAGEPLLILGQSGSGKTMICRALFGLTDRYDFDVSGQIVFEGEDILSADAKKRRKLYGSDIALIPQNPMTAFDPSCKIGNQLAETYRLHNKSSAKAARNAVLEAMQRAGLEDCKAVWSSYPYMLSGGMLQRAAVAAAIMNRPRLIIADEPTTALDVTIQAQIMNLLKELQQETGMAMILITHDIGVVANMADRVLVMYAGQMIERAPSKELFYHPAHPYTQALLDTVPTIRDDADRQLVSIPGIVPESYDDITGCRFADRCAYACPLCEQPQEDYVMGAEHTARCIVMKNRWERADESEKQKSQQPETLETSVCEEKGGSAGE